MVPWRVAESPKRERRMLTVGILNNMPEAAIRSTERQLGELLSSTSSDLHLRWFSFQPRRGYEGVEDLWAFNHLDGLIVTGTEPRASVLSDEPYWLPFITTVEWATTHTTSTVWSCLAAHATVLHLDGIERTRLPAKLSGVFEIMKKIDHPLLTGIGARWDIPHSRFNDLSPMALRSRGYQILSHCEQVGADLFANQIGKSLFVFMQGHPEYDARALMREYRRDVLRFLTGERDCYPEIPVNYVDGQIEDKLQILRERALLDRHPDVMVEMQTLIGHARLSAPWKPVAEQLYRNWLDFLGARVTLKPSGIAL
jgi:homoserine O-succinyltransferase/O-acetyltransferase